MTCHNFQFALLAVVLSGVSGCMGTEAELARADDEEAESAEVGQTRIALRKAASATAGADGIDGYCEHGVGVYLSAVNDTAALTLYVVAPAEAATFERPALHLTVQQGESQTTESTEFETVTLAAGESHVFSKAAEGRLMDVVAEVDAE